MKKLTEEHKRKIGLANKGKIKSKELRERISTMRKGIHFAPNNEFKKGFTPWMKGRIQTDEHKKKMVATRMKNGSYKHSKEYRIKMSKMMTGRKVTWGNKISYGLRGKPKFSIRGEKHWKWNGGSPENKKIRGSLEYVSWRYNIYKRDWFTCQMPGCGYKGRFIEAHHIKTFKNNPELRFEVSNGITLCRDCHNKTRTRESQFESIFTEILKIKYGCMVIE